MVHNLALVLENIRKMAAVDDLAAVLVHLNDTYMIEESPNGRLPGMARVATVVDKIRAEVFRRTGRHHTLVMHSGDFMMPSRLGRLTNGAAMTKMLAQFVDVIALGNHEFDLKTGALADRLQDLAARRVKVVCSNVTFPRIPFEGIWTDEIVYWPDENAPLFAIVGIMGEGICPVARDDKGAIFEPAEQAINRLVATGLRKARRLIVLSHDERTEDLQLQESLNRALTARPGFAYLLGGHDHEVDWSQRHNGSSPCRTVFSKCRSNAKSVRVFLVSRSQLIVDELRRLTLWFEGSKDSVLENLAESPHLGPLAITFRDALIRLSPTQFHDFLLNKQIGCDVGVRLNAKALRAEAPAPEHSALACSLVGERTELEVLITRKEALIDITDASTRSRQTPFGRFVATCVKKGTDADIAIIHAGSFRGDDMMGPNLDTHLLEDVFIYDDLGSEWEDGEIKIKVPSIVVVRLETNVVRAILQHGRAKMEPDGRFPQTSELTENEELLLSGSRTLKVAIASYLLCDNHDGYRDILKSKIGTPKSPGAGEEWSRKDWSITNLVRQNHGGVVGDILDEPDTWHKTGPGGRSEKARTEFTDAADPILGWFNSTRKPVTFADVVRALRGRNYDSTAAWRELDDYATHVILVEDALARCCTNLLDWWSRTHEEWELNGMDPYEELQILRNALYDTSDDLAQIAEGLGFYADYRREHNFEHRRVR